jgi:hypothetical protein
MKNITKLNILHLMFCMILLTNCGGSGSGSSSSSSSPDLVVTEESTTLSADGTGVKFDNDTELQTGFNGFSVEKAYIVDGDNKKIADSEIALNTRFSIVYEGVKNYTIKDGKVFPGISIQVTDNDQNTVISEADQLLSHTEGLDEKDASMLRATVAVSDPIKPGKYIVSVVVTDKNNGDAAINSTWSFEVK